MSYQKASIKWRPTLTMIVAGLLAIVLALPIGSLYLFRFYDAQLVRETESELIAQAAAISSVMQHFVEQRIDTADLPILPDITKNAKKLSTDVWQPVLPQLKLFSETILPSRPDGVFPAQGTSGQFQIIGKLLLPIISETQEKTLAGFRILDPNGVVIAGRNEIGLSLAHIHEVNQALQGKYSSVVRIRYSDSAVPPLTSISRGTGIRIFVAMPVQLNDRLAGVVYVSRTPNSVLRALYEQRFSVLVIAAAVILATLAIGLIFILTVKKPIDALRLRSERLGRGERDALAPLKVHGSREFAELSDSTQEMARKLFDRSDYINTFAAHVSHELKSPLTSIHGAAELLREKADEMSEAQRNQFLRNISADTDRLVVLLDQLRMLAKADNPILAGTVPLQDITSELRALFPDISFDLDAEGDPAVNMAHENALIVFSNMIENAASHGATRVDISTRHSDDELIIKITDNGTGISAANANKVFDLFFTTRRESNGTGMGLNIVKAMLEAHGGRIYLEKSGMGKGTTFEIAIPLQDQGS
ncbi:MAG: sensor histidine kinase [Rhizobiaceae bacterium]